ncbi:MAG: OsmC family protein [Geobacteraceae bacterium]|nr:OsmC family protein [Geobacteraceae bacterium]
MNLTVTLDGGKKVTAHYPDGLSMVTDQSIEAGGEGSAPSPFMVFLGAIATCAGVYVENFCSHRSIPTTGISLTQQAEFTIDDNGKRTLAKVSLQVHLPAEFPEKYRTAVLKAAELCAVKKAIANPPAFEITAVTA